MSAPSISVVLPVYNGEALLAEAVTSVFRQGHPDLEVIIVDDGSTDGTAKAAAALKGEIRYLRQENAGPAAARNRGLALARGEVIGFIDADDLWSPDKLAKQLPPLMRDPALGLVMGRVQLMRLEGAHKSAEWFKAHADPFVCYQLGSALFRKSAFDRIGPFDEALRQSEDVDWFVRARERGLPMLIEDHMVMYYRIHGDNITSDIAARQNFFMAALQKSLARRRGAAGGRAASLPKFLPE